VRTLLLASIACCFPASAATVQVFLAAGQSNANTYWANGIETTFNSLLGAQNVEVVNSQHGGAPMWMWSSGGSRGSHYQDDLAALVARIEQIEANGDTAVFAGVLWMQGESDVGQASTIPIYDDRFRSMLGFYQQDLGLAESPSYIVGVTDANTADPLYSSISPANLEALRAIQFALGDEPGGEAFDSRGYPRTDLWHLNAANATLFGEAMAYQFAVTNNVPEPSVAILALAGVAVALRRRR
jgi:hypothetical protein